MIQFRNEIALQTAADPSLSPQEKGIAPFMAVKTKLEKAVWDWISREKPGYAFNTFLLDTVTGPIFDPKNQPGSTAGWVRWVYDGQNLEMLGGIMPQFYIDGRDAGKLYVAALATGLSGARVYGCAGNYSWYKILEILKGLYPEKDFADMPDPGENKAIVASETPRKLLKVLGQERYISLEESVKDGIESLL